MSKKLSPKPLDPRRMSDTHKAEHIRSVVLKAGEDLRARHPWLRHQDAIGAVSTGVSVPCSGLRGSKRTGPPEAAGLSVRLACFS